MQRDSGTYIRSLSGLVLIALAATLLWPSSAAAQRRSEDRTTIVSNAFVKSHQLGGRIGGWSNQGRTNVDSLGISANSYYLSDMNSVNAYLEGYFGYRFNNYLMLETSLGLVSRGDVTLVEEDGGSSIGSLMIYPILAKLKLYPLGGTVSKFHPYIMGGGGVYYARHTVEIATGYDAYFRQSFGSDSETKISYVLGGGLEWPVATMVGLDLNVQYLDARFSDDIIGIKDYSSLTITVGVKHLFRNTDNEK